MLYILRIRNTLTIIIIYAIKAITLNYLAEFFTKIRKFNIDLEITRYSMEHTGSIKLSKRNIQLSFYPFQFAMLINLTVKILANQNASRHSDIVGWGVIMLIKVTRASTNRQQNTQLGDIIAAINFINSCVNSGRSYDDREK